VKFYVGAYELGGGHPNCKAAGHDSCCLIIQNQTISMAK
jgi:hypothetical protein